MLPQPIPNSPAWRKRGHGEHVLLCLHAGVDIRWLDATGGERGMSDVGFVLAWRVWYAVCSVQCACGM